MAKSLYISGAWEDGKDAELVSYNPATQAEVWRGKTASAAQVEEAIAAARDAFGTWMSLSIDERCRYLEKFTQILTTRSKDLAQLLSEETGKPLWEAKTELTAMIGKFEISKQAFAERCKQVTKEIPGAHSITRHKPHGVVVVLGPFNFPGHLPNGHIIPALLAGNTVVFKPSELTPLFAIKIIECWHDAELPHGALNLVLGKADVGQHLLASKDIDAVFFTGSYATGHQIAINSLDFSNRIIALEMGGNNPLIVTAPQNIDAAVYVTLQSAYTTAGQRCTCARRLIVTKDEQSKKFVQRLIEAIPKIKVGTYTDQPEPFMGPLISKDAAHKVFEGYKQLLNNGAKVLVPMQRLGEDSAFLSPGFIDVSEMQNVPDEEIFGPLLRLTWVDNINSAIIEANNTAYGLSAGLISDIPLHYQQFMQYIKAGVVSWNRPTIGSSSAAPFGGIGKSGNHRPSAYYAADYCSYPIASMEDETVKLPENLNPGITL
jgi:succinylglutamic semialdehyde dehydrogenase